MDFCIETERLRLRKFSMEDVGDFFEMTRDPDIRKYLPHSYYETTEEVEKAFKKYYFNGDCIHDFYLMIEEKEHHQIIGTLIVTQDIFGYFNVNRMISKKFRRNGYSLEALRGFIKQMSKGDELLFIIEESNENSLNSIQKLQGIKDYSDCLRIHYSSIVPVKIFVYEV